MQVLETEGMLVVRYDWKEKRAERRARLNEYYNLVRDIHNKGLIKV